MMRDWTRTFGPLEIEFEWDHGPDLTITFFGRRTHIIGLWWSAYPVLGGARAANDRRIRDRNGGVIG